MQADRLENLCAAVALDGGDAHLGHRLDDPLDGSLDEIFDRLFVIQIRQHPLQNHVIQRFECQIWVYGVDTVAEQHGKMVNFPWFTRFKNQRNQRTGTAVDQVVVQA